MWTCMHAKSLQSCLTLCDPMDCSPLGTSVHGILHARILEWAAVSFSLCGHNLIKLGTTLILCLLSSAPSFGTLS